jgi:hypothetical protein
MNLKILVKNVMILLVGLMFIVPVTCFAFGSIENVGKIVVKAEKAYVMRNGKQIPIGGFGLILKKGDQVVTNASGKAHIILEEVNDIFLGPSSKLTLDKSITKKDSGGISRFFLTIFGKLRAKVKKSKKRSLTVRTATAVIGVKGTDFIVEHVNNLTTVGTLKGLVNMKSNTNQQEIDIPPGKMCSVSAAGEVLALEEFAGKLLTNMEFAGEQMEAEDFSGEKIEF